MTKEEIRALKKDLSHVVLSDLNLEDSVLLLAFVPMKSEVDINPLIEKYKKQGLEVAFPEKQAGFYRKLDGSVFSVDSISCKATMLVPGVAFTTDGCRLGRGGGWYDRAIKLCGENIETIGVCKKSQVLDYIPTEEHDMKVKKLVVV